MFRTKWSASMQCTREAVIRKLREKGWKYQRSGDRADIYRRGTERTNVPRRDLIQEITVRSILRMGGCDDEEIASFIAICQS